MTAEDKETQKKLKELAEKDKQEYLAKARSRHKGAEGAPEYKLSFKPAGPNEYKDL